MQDTPAIRVRGVTVGFGERTVLDQLSIDVRRGEILGLVGGSGSGTLTSSASISMKLMMQSFALSSAAGASSFSRVRSFLR